MKNDIHPGYGYRYLIARGQSAIIRRLESCGDDSVATTVITRIEVLRGRFDHLLKAAMDDEFLHAQRLLQTSEAKLNKLLTCYLDEKSLREFRALLHKKGLKKIGRADLLIASIALANRATLVTRNLKHFKLIPQLACENRVD
jgi:tRNA(fMet)-specific endonuclease VapC